MKRLLLVVCVLALSASAFAGPPRNGSIIDSFGNVTWFNDYGHGNGSIQDPWGNVTFYSGGLRPRPVYPIYRPMFQPYGYRGFYGGYGYMPGW